jgi:Protein of unknown function (DUF2971)
LLVSRLLYHSLPDTFNDPFECRPHWKWPNSATEVRAIRQRLYRVAKSRGASKKEAESFCSKCMQSPDTLGDTILDSVIKNFGKIRICSYTTSNTNILLWSHYADSHRGLCVEFDSSKAPIGMSMKVHYQDEYPHLQYPLPDGTRGLETVLTKSSHWSYEDEFRSILGPKTENQPKNDGESFYLPSAAVTNIFCGAAMRTESKDAIAKFAELSDFKPAIWHASLSKSSFSVTFERVNA